MFYLRNEKIILKTNWPLLPATAICEPSLDEAKALMGASTLKELVLDGNPGIPAIQLKPLLKYIGVVLIKLYKLLY